MRNSRVISLAIFLVSPFAMHASVADEELRWRGYNVLDEATGGLIHGATKSYIVTAEGGGGTERRIGYQCNNGQPILTFDVGEYLAESSTDYELYIWIDDRDAVILDMRVWSNSTSGGYSRVEVVAKELFEPMRAGTRLSWRINRTDGHIDGIFSLIGFTAASREFAAACTL